jgi:dihydroflavonol-4-reductase
MSGVEAVIHTAAPSPVYSLGAGREIVAALKQTRGVLAAARRAGVSRFIYTSSPAILKPGERGPATEESHHTGPVRSAYHKMKLALEKEVLAAGREGLPVVVLKAAAVYGERDIKPSGGELLLGVARREIPMYAEVPLSAADIRDVARGHALALEKARPGLYLLGGENTTLGPIVRLAAKVAGVPPPRRVSVGTLLRLGTLLGVGSEIVGKVSGRPEPKFPLSPIGLIAGSCAVDSSKARKEFGYDPGPIAPAVERAVRWFKENGYF